MQVVHSGKFVGTGHSHGVESRQTQNSLAKLLVVFSRCDVEFVCCLRLGWLKRAGQNGDLGVLDSFDLQVHACKSWQYYEVRPQQSV